MSQVAPTTITPLGAPPQTSSPSTFAALADALLGALPNMVAQINAIATNVYNNAVDCFNNAVAAAASALSASNSAVSAANSVSAAAAAAGAIAWVSGTTYSAGNVVYSPANFQTYRRMTNGAGTTDPSLDGTNWYPLTAFPSFVTKNAAYMASARDRIKADTLTNGAFSITFPAAPNDGDQIEIMDIKSNFAVANCSILGNGKTVMGCSTLALNIKNLHVVFTYDAALGDWRI